MTLDPSAAELLRRAALLDHRPLEEIPVHEARALEVRKLQFAAPPEPLAKISASTIAGPRGEVPVRVYEPIPAGRLPVIIFLHGGGWTVGGLEVSDAQCRALAVSSRATVVAVDYRLAPEHRYPAALEDAYAAVTAFARVGVAMAVVGDSAGGNLAAAITLLARDRGGPQIAHQVLIYPMLDPGGSYLSRQTNATGYGLTSSTAAWFWGNYLGNTADPGHAYAAPMRAGDLSGLPPATVITAEHDPLRDEGIAYGERLRRAGVPVHSICYRGQIHGFWSCGAVIPAARDLTRDTAEDLRAALQRSVDERAVLL